MQYFSAVFAAVSIFIGASSYVQGLQPCPTSFAQAIADEGNLFFVSSGIRLGGFTAKLPDPNVGITIFAPTNNAVWKLLTSMNLGFWDMLGLSSHINGILLYHVLLGAYDVPALLRAGTDNTLLGLSLASNYNLTFIPPTDPSFTMNIKTRSPSNNAGVQKTIRVCESYIHVITEILLPTDDGIGGIPDVDLNMLTSLVSDAPPPAGALPLQLGPVDPACNTTFVDAARNTTGLDVLVQAIRRAGLEDALPSPGAGLTAFAPTNGAFLQMMQALHLDIGGALALGDKLQSILLYHFVQGARTPAALAQSQQLDTLLGMDLGRPFPLAFRNLPNGQVGLSGLMPNNSGTIIGTVQVCTSLVHIVDVVLMPAATLDSVPHPFAAPTAAPSAAPGPALPTIVGEGTLIPRMQPRALPPQTPCGQSLLSAADAAGLSFVTQALDAAKLIDKIPDPGSQALTFFAPQNGAFYDVLTNTDFGLDQLSGLGDRFQSVLLYHIVPSGAYSLEELVSMGKADTLLGTTIGIPTPLRFSGTQSGWALVEGLYPNNTARILKNVTVCQSVMYVVDHVLIPAPTLEQLPQPYAQGTMTNTIEDCNNTVLDVLNKDLDMTLAFSMLEAANLEALASDPTTNLTLFVPTNQAILDGLDYLNLTLADAQSQKEKLDAMIRYHVITGARTIAQLAAARQLPTFLGASYPLRFESGHDSLLVTGKYSQAQTQGVPIRSCSSVVYKIDVVLLPAQTLAALPGNFSAALASPPAAAFQSPLTRQVVGASSEGVVPDGTALPSTPTARGPQLTGVAFGAGYLSGCQVSFTGADAAGTAVTDSAGRFGVPVPASSRGPMYVQLEGKNCSDTATRLPPPFSMGALMPDARAGVTSVVAVNAITTGGYVIRRRINDPQFALYTSFLGGSNFRAEDLYGLLGLAFGLQNPSSIGTTDYLGNMQRGDAGATKLQSLNAMLQASLTIGSQLLVALKNGTSQPVTVDQAAEALYLAVLPVGFNVLTAGSSFSTSDPSTLAAIFQGAMNNLRTSAPSGARRHLLQAAASAPAPSAKADPVAAAAQAAAELNSLLEGLAKVGAGFDGKAVAGQMAQVVLAAQRDVAPAAVRMLLPPATPGALPVADFLASFTGPSLLQQLRVAPQGT